MKVLIARLIEQTLAQLAERALVEAMHFAHLCFKSEEELALGAELLLGNLLNELLEALVVTETKRVRRASRGHTVLGAPFFSHRAEKVLAELHLGGLGSSTLVHPRQGSAWFQISRSTTPLWS